MEHIYISDSPETTIKIAQNFACQLHKNDTIVLSGELGAGKTKFIEGILTHFKLEELISSPTFNIVNEYNTTKFTIYHFDLYRLEDICEFYEIGGDEYFENGVCLIEWGEKFKEVLPKRYIQISFEKDINNENLRILKFNTFGDTFQGYFDNII